VKAGTPRELVESTSKTYRLSFFVDRSGAPKLLKNLPGVSRLVDAYPKITMEIETPEVVTGIIKVLNDNGVHYSFLNLKTASLEDVYLEATGREYQET
jgi:hypothetical protein